MMNFCRGSVARRDTAGIPQGAKLKRALRTQEKKEWRRADLNCRHRDYETPALPTELRRREARTVE